MNKQTDTQKAASAEKVRLFAEAKADFAQKLNDDGTESKSFAFDGNGDRRQRVSYKFDGTGNDMATTAQLEEARIEKELKKKAAAEADKASKAAEKAEKAAASKKRAAANAAAPTAQQKAEPLLNTSVYHKNKKAWYTVESWTSRHGFVLKSQPAYGEGQPMTLKNQKRNAFRTEDEMEEREKKKQRI